ncbi:AMP-binding protein [Pseudonocardia sp. ICBG601]|uniref:AMP-binding protein n=1 Tax=Pseudonocardia sp. ICBG601 TaxID=2846759 RepID=UPI0027E234BD|nr:AMP-binding protein [Pseudonocardia sp. ICBG601]
MFGLRPGDRVVCWLPLAHIAERDASYYMAILFGLDVTTCANPREIGAALREVRPHSFFAVPRIWEKLKAGVEAAVAAREPRERALVVDGGDRRRDRGRPAHPGRGAGARRARGLGRGRRAGPGVAAGRTGPGRGAAGQHRCRPERAGADAVLPRDRRPARRDLRHVGELRGVHLQTRPTRSASAPRAPRCPGPSCAWTPTARS